MLNKDAKILNELAKELNEISQNESQEKKRKIWRSHNSLKHTGETLTLFRLTLLTG